MHGTQAEFARHLGVSQAYVSTLKKSGRLVIDGEGKVDFSETERALEGERHPGYSEKRGKANANPKPAGIVIASEPDGSMESYRRDRARKMKADADRAELEAAQLAGELIRRADVKFVLDDVSISFVSALTAMPAQLAPVIAPMSEISEVAQAIESHVRAIVEQLHKTIGSRYANP